MSEGKQGNNMDEARQGSIVVQDNKITINDPVGSGSPALLIPPEEGATVTVNGDIITEAVNVSSADKVDIDLTRVVEEEELLVKVSQDGLLARLKVTPRLIRQYSLMDSPYTSKLYLKVDLIEKKEKIITSDDAKKALSEAGVVYGIDNKKIEEVVDAPDGQYHPVAFGEKAVNGKDGYVEYHITSEAETVDYNSDDTKVDFREKFKLPTVEKGDLIATIYPPEEGKEGHMVTDEAIAPKPGKPAQYKLGEGLEEQGKNIFAATKGRLLAKGNSLNVTNLYKLHGDVNMESGNIRFQGEVHILGSVHEGMVVSAEKDLLLDGSAYGASLAAGGQLFCQKNIIKSTVQAGLFKGLAQELLPAFEEVLDSVNAVFGGIYQVLANAEAGEKKEALAKEMPKITKMVTSKVEPKLTEKVKELQEKVKQKKYKDLEKAGDLLIKVEEFIEGKENIEKAQHIVVELNGIKSLLKEYLQEPGDITVKYVQNSTLNTSGKIIINGQGCLYSSLVAHEGVKVDGVFKGGKIVSGGNVVVKEAKFIGTGSSKEESKDPVRIAVPQHRSIFFESVGEDTTVRIGKMIYRFEKPMSKAKVSYDARNGAVAVSKW